MYCDELDSVRSSIKVIHSQMITQVSNIAGRSVPGEEISDARVIKDSGNNNSFATELILGQLLMICDKPEKK